MPDVATMSNYLADEAAFDVEVDKIIKDSVETTIGANAYQHNRVNQWTSSIMEQCLSQLARLNKSFKYIVTCIITQKNGAGLQSASACFWDNSADDCYSVKWENEFMYCNISVFALAI